MENKKNLIGKILFAIYGISCLIMAFFMNLSYGYNEIITKYIKNNRGKLVTESIENAIMLSNGTVDIDCEGESFTFSTTHLTSLRRI